MSDNLLPASYDNWRVRELGRFDSCHRPWPNSKRERKQTQRNAR